MQLLALLFALFLALLRVGVGFIILLSLLLALFLSLLRIVVAVLFVPFTILLALFLALFNLSLLRLGLALDFFALLLQLLALLFALFLALLRVVIAVLFVPFTILLAPFLALFNLSLLRLDLALDFFAHLFALFLALLRVVVGFIILLSLLLALFLALLRVVGFIILLSLLATILSLFDFFFSLFPLGVLALLFAFRFFPLRVVFSFALLLTLGGVVVSLRSSILSVVGGGGIHASVNHSLRDSLRASTFSSNRPRGQSVRLGRCRDSRFLRLFPLLGDSRRLAPLAASLAARLSRLGDAGGNRRARQRTRLLRRILAHRVHSRLGSRRDSFLPSRLARAQHRVVGVLRLSRARETLLSSRNVVALPPVSLVVRARERILPSSFLSSPSSLARAQSRIVLVRVLLDAPRASAERRARPRRRRRQPSVRHRRRRRDAVRDDRHDDRERRRARDGEPEVRASTPRGRSR